MSVKYRVWGYKIERIEIERETDHYVILKKRLYGNRENKEKKDGWRKYFDTWQEAHQSLLDDCKAKLQREIKSVEYFESKLQAIKDMEEPCQKNSMDV